MKIALQLFAARGYESVSMREIAREAKMPIATVYQYFPMKLAIVREMWTRYTSTISETLAEGIRRSEGGNDSNHLIGIMVDRMAELQASNPAFIEIWSCVAASIDLRALNVEDTLQNARFIADALQKKHPESDPSAVYDRALIAVEMASATTRFALALPEPHRARVLLSLKDALALLLEPVTVKSSSLVAAWAESVRTEKTPRRCLLKITIQAENSRRKSRPFFSVLSAKSGNRGMTSAQLMDNRVMENRPLTIGSLAPSSYASTAQE